MKHRTTTRKSALAVTMLAVALFGASCSSDKAADTEAAAETEAAAVETTAAAATETTAAAATETTAAAAPAVDIAAVCPNPLVVQTDWFLEVDHSELYAVAAPGGKVEKDRYTAPLVDPRTGQQTGIDIEIRNGGPAVGFQNVTALMYQDPKIFMGYIGTSEAAQNFGDKPTVGVIAPREKSPQIIMWDPATYPDVKTIADLKGTGAKVRYFDGAVYMDYLTGSGILDPKQVDGSYDGKPANFIADGGKAAQQGFATAEPYNYENDIKEWGKPVAYQLIADAGFDEYAESIAVKPESITEKADCLKAVVPILQAGQVSMQTNNKPVEDLIVAIVKEQNAGWDYSSGLAASATAKSLSDGIISNGPDATLGNFDEAKVQKVMDILGPIFAKKNAPMKDGLKPTYLFTNAFIDPSIGLK